MAILPPDASRHISFRQSERPDEDHRGTRIDPTGAIFREKVKQETSASTKDRHKAERLFGLNLKKLLEEGQEEGRQQEQHDDAQDDEPEADQPS